MDERAEPHGLDQLYLADRSGIVITSVDGAPDIEQALKSETMVEASSSQDPYAMAQRAVELGHQIMQGQKPEQTMHLMEPQLITRDNVNEYKCWTAPRS